MSDANGPADPAARSPRAEFARRLKSAQAGRDALERRVGQLANARLLAFAAAAVLAWLALGAGRISAWWLMPPALGFAVSVAWSDRAERALHRARRLVEYYERGLARLDDRWAGAGVTGDRFRDPEHPYAEDLDLFGVGSLFERLCTARTHAGEDTLAAWLLDPAPPDEVRRRQEAVAELRPRLDLRADLAVLGSDVGDEAAFAGLAEWGAAPRLLHNSLVRWAALLLALLNLPTLVGWLFLGWPPWPFLALAVASAALGAWYWRRVRAVLAQLERRAHELELLAGMLARLERESFAAPELVRARAALDVAGRPASARIERLRRWVVTLEARRNMLLAPFSPLLLWGTQIAFAVEAWRAVSGPAVGGWLAALGEFEALASLAAFAYENPDDAVPELVEAGPPLLDAEGLGHPLLPAARTVRNDVRLGGDDGPRVLVVSGSNMSGKSTLLRAVGCAVVLAMAGGVVRARRLALSPLVLGATLRVQDSLQAGRSRFYAEILRLRRILDLAGGPRPLLFLLDEILAGTNSHDRRIGAEAIVAGLVERGAIGLVTTHDLALAEIAERLAGRAANVHFADHLDDGHMVFDYRMRPGVVRHSNALALMRSVGLEV
jgi:hypothetical protein